jgi:molybdate transport system substrate-binding protein
VRRALLWAGVLAAAGCQRPETQVDLHIFAASSLSEAFTALAPGFEAAHPGVRVRLTFAGSQTLRLQLEQGAAADVFASANAEHVEALAAEGRVEAARPFARNHLVLIVPLEDPAGIESFAQLPRARRLVIGTPQVPVGAYTRQALLRAEALYGPGFSAAVLSRVVSEESNVRLVRAKVAMGEADAAVVYASDAVGGAPVRALPLPDAAQVPAEYWAAAVTGGPQRALAEAWLQGLGAPEAQAVLTRLGFEVGR